MFGVLMRHLDAKVCNHLADSKEQKLFALGIEGTLVPVLFCHGQSRNDYGIVQLFKRVLFSILISDETRLVIIHRQSLV